MEATRNQVLMWLAIAGFLAGGPGGGQRDHGSGGDGVVQLGGAGLFQRGMVVHHQQGLSLRKKLLGCDHGNQPPILREL